MTVRNEAAKIGVGTSAIGRFCPTGFLATDRISGLPKPPRIFGLGNHGLRSELPLQCLMILDLLFSTINLSVGCAALRRDEF